MGKNRPERLVCLQNGRIAGYAHVEDNELSSVAIAPEMQRQGLGGQFVQAVCNRILADGHRTVVLYCVVGNPARRLYERLGFTERAENVYALRFDAPLSVAVI